MLSAVAPLTTPGYFGALHFAVFFTDNHQISKNMPFMALL
jgi:hypothetical protein